MWTLRFLQEFFVGMNILGENAGIILRGTLGAFQSYKIPVKRQNQPKFENSEKFLRVPERIAEILEQFR